MLNVHALSVPVSLTSALLSGCSFFSARQASVESVAGPTVAVTYPAQSVTAKKVGWSTRLEGTCSVDSEPVDIRAADGTLLATPSCVNQAWKAYVDLSALAVGSQDLLVSQTDTEGLESNVVHVLIGKTNSNCDSALNRARNLVSGLGGGAGTVTSPYIVCTPDQLQAITGTNTVDSFLLQNDIDFDNTDTNGDLITDGADNDYVTGSGWTPVNLGGEWARDDYFDGGNFEVRGLRVANSIGNAGLFGSFERRALRNLKVLGADVTGDTSGVVASTCGYVLIENVHAEGKAVSIAGPTGGLCAIVDAVIARSTFKGEILSLNQSGGLVGRSAGRFLVVTDSSADAEVTGATSVGGLVGTMGSAAPSVVFNSFSKGSVKGTSNVGGLIGTSGTIRNSYSTAKIGLAGAANSFYGGLSGLGAEVYNSFFGGNIDVETATNYFTIGASLNANVNNHYWSGGTCLGATTCQLQGTAQASLAHFQLATNAPLSSWDFTATNADGTDDSWTLVAGNFPDPWWKNETSFTAPFAGAGTLASPYLISTPAELARIGTNPRYMGSVFRFTANMNMTATSVTFNPIGRHAAFYGDVQGNFSNVSNLTLNRPADSYLGLFSSVIFAVIDRVILTNVSVSGGYFAVGGLAGFVSDSTIMRNRVSGDVTGMNEVGGSIGRFIDGYAGNMSASANVNGVNRVGGLYGYRAYGLTTNNYAVSAVTGVDSVGGLIGQMQEGSLQRSYAAASVNGSESVGGLIGERDSGFDGEILHCFVVATVAGSDALSNIGPIIGKINVGGEAGSTNNFDSSTDSVCMNNGGGGCNTTLVNSAITSDFYDSTKAPLSSWNFADDWMDRVGTGEYPELY